MRRLQSSHFGIGWDDIGYNFVVGGDGCIYEGRGWDNVGAHAKGYNSFSIGVSFQGHFSNQLPSQAQMRAAKILFEEGVRLGKVDPNYRLIAHRQVSATESPGQKLFEALMTWPHWSKDISI